MRLTVLGKSPSWQDAGGACSGYLVEAAGARLLLDCGPGVFGKLRAVADYRAVDAVVLSHLHADHVLDLVPFASGLRFGPGARARPVLHLPPGGAEKLADLTEGASMGRDHLSSAFDVREYDPAAPLETGPFMLSLREVPHFIRTFAMDVRADGARLTYGADCGPNDALCELATDTPLLIAEATVPEHDPDGGHLTAQEAGEHAKRAGAARLLVTHLSDELDQEVARAAAEAAFGGPVELARDGAVIELDVRPATRG
jgi:ribonuclease BN (tRNA processing enzyme)